MTSLRRPQQFSFWLGSGRKEAEGNRSSGRARPLSRVVRRVVTRLSLVRWAPVPAWLDASTRRFKHLLRCWRILAAGLTDKSYRLIRATVGAVQVLHASGGADDLSVFRNLGTADGFHAAGPGNQPLRRAPKLNPVRAEDNTPPTACGHALPAFHAPAPGATFTPTDLAHRSQTLTSSLKMRTAGRAAGQTHLKVLWCEG
jgi:hypothetical protein